MYAKNRMRAITHLVLRFPASRRRCSFPTTAAFSSSRDTWRWDPKELWAPIWLPNLTIFKSLQATLREAGADFGNVARLTIYVRDYHPEMLPTIRTVRERYLKLEQPPASTLIGVAALALPDLLVEVEAIAAIPFETLSN